MYTLIITMPVVVVVVMAGCDLEQIYINASSA